jgi:hypothetical protein
MKLIMKDWNAFISEGMPPGEVSSEDFIAAITLAIAGVFQELRPTRQTTAIAYDAIAESLDVIFSQNYADSERVSKLLGFDPSANNGLGAKIESQ